jgi:GDP/UDP-N,N'-diacetylbacillosamine 2-epimerase (hydrolysing)
MASRKRIICVLTGTRAEYGLLKPVMSAINKHSKLELKLIVTGMHLSKEFGYSINEIKKDCFKVDKKVVMNPDKDTGFSMANAVGKGIIGISKSLKSLKPDILLILGDRIEALAGTIAAAYMNILIAHIHGGDNAGAGLDESVRHSITKFAHIHFPATIKSAERIEKLGENKKMIFEVGAPCIDTIQNSKFLSKKELNKRFNINMDEGFILLIQHPVTTKPEDSKKQIIITLEAIKKTGLKTISIYPNSDAGGREIIKQIKQYKNKMDLETYKNLSHKDYLSLMKYAKVMIGNSSSGIIESASFSIPVINIGKRQEGRERSTNVIDAEYKQESIKKAFDKALSKEFQIQLKHCKSSYGEGKSGEKIAKILAEIKMSKDLLQKKLAY